MSAMDSLVIIYTLTYVILFQPLSLGRLLDIGFSEKIDEFSSSFIVLKQDLDSGIALHTAFVSARIKDRVDAICESCINLQFT